MWKDYDHLNLPDITREQFDALFKEHEAQLADIALTRSRLIRERKERHQRAARLNDVCCRMRNLVRALYGSDAIELKQAGAVIRSERKTAQRPAATDTGTVSTAQQN
jgi:hypothetical protein